MPKIDIVNAKNIIESNPEKAFFKLKNTGGPKGDTGAQGPQGPKGDTGAQGPAGASASVTVGSTTTLSPGADATVTNSGDTRNAILNFGIPTGAQGPQGIQGPKGDTGPMGPKGSKGDTGAAATVQVGNTNTGAPGTNAQVTNAGNEHFAVFNFTIPRGDKGEKGATGAQGAKGDKGDKGDAGTAATIAVGSTTTTNPGTNATVTNSGTTSAAVLNFGIPKGATGSVKSEVVEELPETGEEDTFYLVNREATEQTATGKAINFTNSDNSGDITDFQLDGETSQNGTPTPDAPVAVNTTTGENVVKICGKNIWTLASSFQNTSSSAAWVLGDTAVSFQPGTYTFSCTSTASSDVNFITYKYADNIDHNIAFKDVASLTFESEVKKIAILLGGNVSISNIQLELGSTATAYEPNQSYEVNLGKNLLNPTEISSTPVSHAGVDVSLQSDGTILLNGTATGDEWVNIMCGDFTTSIYNIINIGQTTVSSTNTDGTLSASVSNGTVARVIHDNTNGYWAFFIQSGASYNNAVLKIQFEKGPAATDFAPYFTPIELCKIGDYQDYIYKSGGKWYKHKEVGKAVLDGSVAPTATNTDATNTIRPRWESFLSPAPNSPAADRLLAKSNRFQAVSNWNADVEGIYYDEGSGGQVWFRISKTLASNQTQVVSWLQSNPVYLYYPLGSTSQTDTEITNEALITQLDNVASAPLYTGVNNITTITPNEQGTLEIKYVTYDKYNQNKVYIWNDTLQQWQIIVQ